MRQVPGEHAVPEFRSSGMPDIAGARSRVADGCGDQGLIALACILTEPFFRPRMNRDDIGLSDVS